MEQKRKQPHSAEYFGEYRDFWWNRDYLQLIAHRFRFREIRSVLDVGCGIGHWGQLLLPLLPPDCRLLGVDREPEWVAKAGERAVAAGFADRAVYRRGEAERLPLADGAFDLVTCQTVLIHVADVKAVLGEMLRVLKPGGLLLLAEPNNLANQAVLSNLTAPIVDLLRFALACENGKASLGLGFNSIGDLLPGYLAELGAQDIRVYLSDKATPIYPPYQNREQQVTVEQESRWAEREFWIWDKEETRRYFLAGGGEEAEFETLWATAVGHRRAAMGAIRAGTYHCAGGGITYLIGAHKPPEAKSAVHRSKR